MTTCDTPRSRRVDDSPERSMRVFVSSTFRDMAAERDELMKHVFPEIRRICEERDVSWSEVDLRWGITDEQRAEGKVLPVCLAEIQECRPYFIGILGDRYGWVPDEINPDLVRAEPWLGEVRGHSVTELEILHGVLNNPEMADHAFFYFRDPQYLEKLGPELAERLGEHAQPEEIASLGTTEAERRAHERRAKLDLLKARIRRTYMDGKLRHAPRENYPNPQALGALVRQDLLQLVDEIFPEGSQPDPIVREDMTHAACAHRYRRVFIPRDADFGRLDEHVSSTAAPLAVTGDPGIGKSALLAAWADRYRAAHPSDCVIEHYVDASASSSDWRSLVRRIIGALQQRAGIDSPPPDGDGVRITYAREEGDIVELTMEGPGEAEDLRSRFASALHRPAERATVLVIDGLSQLDDDDQALDLAWLPAEIPAPVRLIVSTRPGRTLDEIRRRHWCTMAVEPLTVTERRTLLVQYLAQHRKSLSASRVERIASAPQTATPLYLLVLLEELRLWGEHETLDARIDRYLEAKAVRDLFLEILQRWEQDYERERPGLVREIMTALWAARHGLTEREILDSVAGAETPLPQAHWAPLHYGAGRALTLHSGLFQFAHEYLREAVETRYVHAGTDRAAAHLRLAALFAGHPAGLRKLLELPWQLFNAEAWPDLFEFLRDDEVTVALWRFRSCDLRAYWRAIEAHCALRLTDACAGTLRAGAGNPALLWAIGSLLRSLGYLDPASEVIDRLARHYREKGDSWNLGTAVGAQAAIYHTRGNWDDAMAAWQEQERVCRRLGNRDGVAASLNGQGIILIGRGHPDQALGLFQEAEGLLRELGDDAALATTLANIGTMLATRGDLDGAMARWREQERICRKLGDRDGLIASFLNQSKVLHTRGQPDEAMACLKQQERLSRELGNLEMLEASLERQADILDGRGDLDGAMACLKEQETICRRMGTPTGLNRSLTRQARILRARGDVRGAMALHQEAERLCRASGDLQGVGVSLGNQALILAARGDLDAAIAHHKEEEQICRQLGDVEGLSASLANQGLLLYRRGEFDAAMALFKEAEGIRRRLGDLDHLQIILGNQALILHDRGLLDEALALQKEKERICRQLGKAESLYHCLISQAAILRTRAQLDEALALVEEAESICRNLRHLQGLAECLSHRALILRGRKKLTEALELHEEEEAVYRQLGEVEGIAKSLGNQAQILRLRGELERAMSLLKEEEKLRRESGSALGLASCLGNQATVLLSRGELGGAMTLEKQAEAEYRRLGALAGLATSLENQATILLKMGSFEDARPLAEEANRLATELGLPDLQRGSLRLLDEIRFATGH